VKRIAAITCAWAIATISVAYGAGAGNPAYVPGLGEIMALQQMRHAKLWFAGSNQNWQLAAYELDELREGFADAINLHPTQDQIPVAMLVDKITTKPLAEVGNAVEERNSARFKKTFDGLTMACNECHQAAKHAYIVIKRPDLLPFGNQDFSIRSK
jgi:hypothetical protein